MESKQPNLLSLKAGEVSIDVGGRAARVSISGDVITIDGERHQYICRELEAGMLSIQLNGISSKVYVQRITNFQEHAAGLSCQINGKTATVFVDDARSRLRALLLSAQARSDVAARVLAPMPGLVTKIEVSVGDSIVSGQGLLILEAMKMENEIRASLSGVITKIYATLGKPVEKSELLVEIQSHL
jgi:pyruvate carboxylase subunit B